MNIKILYRADYHYESPVSFSPHLFRLFPRQDPVTFSDKIVFETNPGADVQHRKDIFDNNIASCFYPEPAADLNVRIELDLRLLEKNAFHFLLDSHALEFPFAYAPDETRVLSPYLAHRHKMLLPFWQPKKMPTVDALVELNSALHRNIAYERREEGAARTPNETLLAGSGACRDFAVLLAETLRGHGVAARLASGYLCEFDAAEKRAGGALHAWTEAYLPGAGWIGLDPTNGIFCNHNHITAALGIAPDDVSPVSGSYFGSERVQSTMETSLQLIRTDEPKIRS
jgi:transglutaminase-like putative cysteine protease